MTIIQEIKDAALTARKARESVKALSLTTLFSEAAMVGKNDGGRETTDAEVVAVIKKFIKNIDETVSKFVLGDARIKTFMDEKHLLSTFLPKQLDEAGIRAELANLKTELNLSVQKDMGTLLKAFKTKFEGSYDGGVAAKLAKEILS